MSLLKAEVESVMSTQKIKVTINGNNYSLVTDESDVCLLEAAALVDQQIAQIQASGVSDQVKSAVLVALQSAHELLKLKQEQEQLKHEQLRLLEKISREFNLLSSF